LLRNHLFKAYKAWEDSEAPGFCSTLGNTSGESGERLFDLSTDMAAVLPWQGGCSYAQALAVRLAIRFEVEWSWKGSGMRLTVIGASNWFILFLCLVDSMLFLMIGLGSHVRNC